MPGSGLEVEGRAVTAALQPEVENPRAKLASAKEAAAQEQSDAASRLQLVLEQQKKAAEERNAELLAKVASEQTASANAQDECKTLQHRLQVSFCRSNSAG